ncbi:hypothetical protein HPB50_003132 [Hyalomma asiaticum]|uniref:Uncharacterized protein n=1 Tax=Hyalomma asiaticum TaxID=266040 RepID=A0ACB7SPK0_HYAAI|nr:hypothetical protein HPB50_003132 [Hyalomma asiaticum]
MWRERLNHVRSFEQTVQRSNATGGWRIAVCTPHCAHVTAAAGRKEALTDGPASKPGAGDAFAWSSPSWWGCACGDGSKQFTCRSRLPEAVACARCQPASSLCTLRLYWPHPRRPASWSLDGFTVMLRCCRAKLLLWASLLLFVAAQLWLAEACPQRCNCLELQVLCQEAGYRELPAPVPRAAVALLLTSNQLERLATDSFRGLVRLRKLILDNNRIQALAPFTFRGLAGLDELSLQNNPLTVLSQQSMSGLSRVRMLQLGFNRIARVEPFAFAGSSDLGSISLEGNPLELLRSRAFANLSRVGSLRLPRSLAAMEPDAFAGLRNVSLVSIEAPRLQRLPQFAFRGLEHAGELLIRDAEIGLIDSGAFAGLSHASVSHVLLSGNWLPCDCRLRWAPESLRRRGFCSSPAHLLNASAAQVSLDTLPRCLPEHFVPHSRPDAPPLSGRQQTSGAATQTSSQSILAAAHALVTLLLTGGSWLQRLVLTKSCLPECYL